MNLLSLGEQKITSIINVRDFAEGQLVMATKNGLVKKSALSAYGNPRANGVVAIRLDANDDLIGTIVENPKFESTIEEDLLEILKNNL